MDTKWLKWLTVLCVLHGIIIINVHCRDPDEPEGDIYESKSDVAGQKHGDEDEGNGADADPDKAPEEPTEEMLEEANKLQWEIETKHSRDPKDLVTLAEGTLEKAWDNNFNGALEVSFFSILDTFENVADEERLHLIRLFELMDTNFDGLINKKEFIELYKAAVAYPTKAIELMFKAQDYDGNGFISPWETLIQSLTLDGINQDILDKWAAASFSNSEKDTNNDGIVGLTDFMAYMAWQMNLGIQKRKIEKRSGTELGETPPAEPAPAE